MNKSELTKIFAGGERIVALAISYIEQRGNRLPVDIAVSDLDARIIFQSLINPRRYVFDNDLSRFGIARKDIAGAPYIGDVSEELISVLRGAVVLVWDRDTAKLFSHSFRDVSERSTLSIRNAGDIYAGAVADEERRFSTVSIQAAARREGLYPYSNRADAEASLIIRILKGLYEQPEQLSLFDIQENQ